MTKPQNTCITFAPPSPDNPHSASFPITTHSRADSLSQHLFALFFLFNVGKMEVVEWIERERAKAKKKKKKEKVNTVIPATTMWKAGAHGLR